ncbi:tRNA (Cytosine(34)-C(5))-methyltransferase-like [Elysia marginata]|uniref:tRNA (Cytosine(34)-C(5))-methyltransferase-like n=1 Tax=Elysia marginata TaxID=1093978 RepID=A0AAV4G0R0_9GAST|nr:tRNA (Cytosine(34)-C(5))-methyltransferase-like [Elysia marginata]
MKNYQDGNKDNRDARGPPGKYDLAARNNELYIKYYKGQNIVPEAEWDEFYATLQKNLPLTFRISGHRAQAEELLNTIKGKFFSNMLNVKVDGEIVPPPKNLTWYPNELGWQLDLTRKIVRSSECFSKLHEFLVAETDCGAISRQEAVSMIPPLVLDIKSHHKILDMCASPGSKTAQLIEYLHSSCAPGRQALGFFSKPSLGE